MTQEQMQRIQIEDMKAGRSDDFSTGRILFYSDCELTDLKRICLHRGIDFNEFYLGYQFQSAVESALQAMKA